ncbi:UPF0392 protein [Striga hermonthica]|uniref:Glycosyltransferase family 92 protein n=1 Tax=Striga hermonthica TaxID=68872 RepID=A0A9N7NR68_STRHE|nr:UPF0392 protein [Striga hermonthica]
MGEKPSTSCLAEAGMGSLPRTRLPVGVSNPSLSPSPESSSRQGVASSDARAPSLLSPLDPLAQIHAPRRLAVPRPAVPVLVRLHYKLVCELNFAGMGPRREPDSLSETVVSSLSLLSSSSYSSTAEPVKVFGTSLPPLEIENKVIFPDHVLLLVAGGVFNADANLRWAGVNNRIFLGGVYEKNGLRLTNHNNNKRKKSCCSWENVVYEAALDGTTIVVFVKGLNVRANRLSDPRLFTCHFDVRKSDMNGNRYNLIRTTALTAAQEVVRCPLSHVVQTSPKKFEEIRVTVGYSQSGRENPLMPSVAATGLAIREWIMYHSWLGVERWFVYDNNSDDGLDKVIQELDQENYNVTRHVWPWIKTQEAGFSHCALKARDECN